MEREFVFVLLGAALALAVHCNAAANPGFKVIASQSALDYGELFVKPRKFVYVSTLRPLLFLSMCK